MDQVSKKVISDNLNKDEAFAYKQSLVATLG